MATEVRLLLECHTFGKKKKSHIQFDLFTWQLLVFPSPSRAEIIQTLRGEAVHVAELAGDLPLVINWDMLSRRAYFTCARWKTQNSSSFFFWVFLVYEGFSADRSLLYGFHRANDWILICLCMCALATCFPISTPCHSFKYLFWRDSSWCWGRNTSIMYPAHRNWISITGLWCVILALEEFNCCYSQRIERICLCCLPRLSVRHNNISANYLWYYRWGSANWRGRGKGYSGAGVGGEKREKKAEESSMLGTDPYSRIHCHSIPNWRGTCMHTAGKRIWHSKIGSGMLLVNFRTLMLLEHPQTYAHTRSRAHTKHKKSTRTHTPARTHMRPPEHLIPR